MKVSASQLAKVQGCVRAAGFHYIDRIQKRSGAQFAADLGKRIHDICRRYVRFGDEPDLTEIMWKPTTNPRNGLTHQKAIFPGQIAQAAFPLLKRGPMGTENWCTETSINGVKLPSGIEILGDIDLAIDENGGEIRDYKTTSDFAYAMDSDELLKDIQANFYGWAWFGARPTPEVTLHWQYLLTKGNPRSHSVRATCTREGNAQEIGRIDREIATPWVKLRLNKISGYSLPPTGLATGQCEKYGGCPYRGLECQITVEDSLRYSGGAPMDLNELLNQKLASQQALAQVAPPAGLGPAPGANPFATPARPSFWIPGDKMNEIQEFAASKGKPLSFIANAADNPPPPDVAASYDAQPKVEAGVINPPESAGMVPAMNPTVAALQQGAPAEESGFEALKAECVRLGIYPEGSKPRTTGLKKLLDAYDVERTKAEKDGLIPPGARPTQAELLQVKARKAVELQRGVATVVPGTLSFSTPREAAQIAQAFQDAGVPVQSTQSGALDFGAVPISPIAPTPAADPVVALTNADMEYIARRAAELTVSRLAEALKKLA